MKNTAYILLGLFLLAPALSVFAQSDTPADDPKQHYELDEYQKERTIALAEEDKNAQLLNVDEALTAIKYPDPVSLSTSDNHPLPAPIERSEGLETVPDHSNLDSNKHKKKGGGFFAFLGDLAVEVSTEASCNNGRIAIGN